MKSKFIKKACHLTDLIFIQIIKNFHLFQTEKDLADFIFKQIKSLDLKPSFPPLVVSQGNYHQIHHKPQKTKLKNFVIIDFGVKYKGYCSDLTRTVFVGKPLKKHLHLYKLVLKTQQKTIQKIKINCFYKDLDAHARVQLQPYQKYFKHALGHGVGRKIHQFPKVSPNSKHRAKLGDTITIEPGIYKRNEFGIRIEDTIYLGKTIQVLTRSSKKLFIFPKKD